MRNGMKIKLAVTVLLLSGMLCSGVAAHAGVALGIGEQSVPYTTGIYRKTTNDACSDLTLGNVSIYDQIAVSTHSEQHSGFFVQSTPWTVCYEYSSTYLGQYTYLEVHVGQRIFLKATQREGITETYAAEFASWDYH